MELGDATQIIKIVQ